MPKIAYDPTMLYNLIENACKYTPPGTVVTVSAETSSDALIVSVSDTGAGIAKGQEQLIFEKFTRGARESSTPGVGLGLAISRAIVEAHHGTIAAANDIDGGARLAFRLPLGTPPETPDEGPLA